MRSIELVLSKILTVGAVACALAAVLAGAAGATSTYLPSIKIGTASLIDPGTGTNKADTYFGSSTVSTDGLKQIMNSQNPTPTPPEIIELARALKNSPDLIYEYVRNNIENEWLYGLQKGALGAELDKAGTDFDQADLMVKLLRQSGYSASYVAGKISLSGQQFTAWTGISDATAACQLLSSGGIPATINDSTTANCGYGVNTPISTVVMSHIWVQVTIPGSSCGSGCLFDPSYKPRTWKTAINLFTATGLNPTDPLNFAAAGMGTGTTLGLSYVNNLNASSLNSHLQAYASNLLTYIKINGYQGSQIEDIIGGGIIQAYVSPQGGLRQSSLPYTATAQHTWSGNIPDQYRTTLHVVGAMFKIGLNVFDTMFDVTFYADEIYGRTLTIESNFSSAGIQINNDYNTPIEYLRLDGVTLRTYQTTWSNSPVGSPTTVTLTANHPYAASADGSATTNGDYMDATVVKPAQAVTPITIVHGWGDTGSAMLAKWSDERAMGTALPLQINYPGGCETCGSYYQGDTGDLLRQRESVSFLAQYTRASHLQAQIAGAIPQLHHVLGLVSANVNLHAIYYDQQHNVPPDFSVADSYDHIDVDAGISLTSKTADAPSRRAALHAIAASSAALEGSTGGQLSDLPDTASTATRFEWANNPPTAEDPPAHGPRNFFQLAKNSTLPTGFALFEGNQTPPTGDPLNYATAPNFYGSEWQGALTNEVNAYTAAGFAVTTTQEGFLGPGQRGGSFDKYRAVHWDNWYGSGQQGDYSVQQYETFLPTKQRGAALVATRYDDATGDPLEIAHIISGDGGLFEKGGGAGVTPDSGAHYDPATAADVMKSRFVDRSGMFGVNLSNGALAYTAPAILDVGNGGLPYELTASLSWHPGPLSFSFGPIIPTRPRPGWNTNWHNELALSSSGLEAMGKSDIRAAAGTIAAFLAAQDIYKSSVTVQRDVAGVLVISWWTHQITGNTVTVSLGTSSTQFVRLADGTWIAPGAGYATLTQTNDRTPYEYRCPFSEPYPLSRGWDEHTMSFKVNNAHGDVQNFSYWMNNYSTSDTSSCAQAKGFRLTSWSFPQAASLNVTLTYGKLTGEEFDRLLSVANTFGREIDFLYDPYNGGFDELAGLKQANSLRQVTLVTPYTGTDSFTDPSGAVTSFSYTAPLTVPTATQRPVPYKLLDKVFTADNATVANMDYDYDGLGRIEQIKDAEAFQVGDRAPYQFYIADGTRGERDDPLGQGYSVVYDTYGHASRYIDELGHETDQAVDSRGRTVSTTYPEGDCELFAYDDHNNPTSYTRIDKSSACNPNAAAPHKLIVTASWNQTWNKPLWVKTPLGYKTSFQYWATGNGKGQVQNATLPDPDGTGGPLTSSVYNYTYDAKGKLATVTDPLGMVTTNAYDSASENLLSTVVDSASGHLALTTQFAYDADGNLLTEVDPLQSFNQTGGTWVYQYDADRRRTESDHHDGTYTGQITAVTKTDYDLLGRIADVKQGKCLGTANPCGAAGNVATWITSKTNTYTPTGKLATVTDADGRTATTIYDNADRTDTVIDPIGRKVHYVYCAPGDASCAANQVKQEIRAYGTTHPVTYATYTYSLNGKQASVYDAMGSSHTTLFAYDGWDRLLTTTYPDTSYEQLTLDKDSNVTARRNRSGQSDSFTFDQMDRMLTRGMPLIANVDPQVTTTWTYLANSAIDTITDTNGNALDYGYDTAERLTSAATTIPGLSGAKTIGYTLDKNSNRTRLTWPDGYYVNYTYDKLNRMIQAADSALTIQAYAWNAMSRRSERDDAGGGAGTEIYTYSDAGDLLTLNHDLSGTADDVQYTLGYTNAHQLASEVSSKTSYNFAPASNGTDSYAVVNSLNQYPAVRGVFYGYDSRGNLTGDGSFTYAYDPENHLILANASGNANTYAYDPLGRRVIKTVNATAVTNFLQDGDTEIAEYDAGGNVLRRFVPGPVIDDLAAMIDCSAATQPNCTGNSKTEFLHVNHQGTTIAVADRSAVKLEGPYTYDAYGSGAARTGVPFKYTGQYLDAETGLYYYRARFYNPNIGTFLQTDPIGYKDNLNLYAYVSDDPVDRIDPTGKVITLSGSQDDQQRFMNIAFNLTGVHLKKDNGKLVQEGDRDEKVGNAKTAKSLLGAINSTSTIKIDAVHQDNTITGDSFFNDKVDVADFEAFSAHDSQFAQAALAHALTERTYNEEHGGAKTQAAFKAAHSLGVQAEWDIMGASNGIIQINNFSDVITYFGPSGSVIHTVTLPVDKNGDYQ